MQPPDAISDICAAAAIFARADAMMLLLRCSRALRRCAPCRLRLSRRAVIIFTPLYAAITHVDIALSICARRFSLSFS